MHALNRSAPIQVEKVKGPSMTRKNSDYGSKLAGRYSEIGIAAVAACVRQVNSRVKNTKRVSKEPARDKGAAISGLHREAVQRRGN